MRNAEAWGKRKRPEPSTDVVLDDSIEMPVSAEVAWAHLQDIDALAACIPGLQPESVVQTSPTTFQGTLRHVALGVPSTWRLTANVVRSEPDRALEVHLDGVEERLGLRLLGDARLVIVDTAPARLDYTGELTVRGRLAGAGGPIIDRVIASIIERFVEGVGAAGDLPMHRGRWQQVWNWIRSLWKGKQA